MKIINNLLDSVRTSPIEGSVASDPPEPTGISGVDLLNRKTLSNTPLTLRATWPMTGSVPGEANVAI